MLAEVENGAIEAMIANAIANGNIARAAVHSRVLHTHSIGAQ